MEFELGTSHFLDGCVTARPPDLPYERAFASILLGKRSVLWPHQKFVSKLQTLTPEGASCVGHLVIVSEGSTTDGQRLSVIWSLSVKEALRMVSNMSRWSLHVREGSSDPPSDGSGTTPTSLVLSIVTSVFFGCCFFFL